MQEKSELRPKLLALRNALSIEEKADFDRCIGNAVLDWWQMDRTPLIGVYWPMRGEPDLHATYAALRAQDVQLALPVVVDDRMPLKFVAWQENDALERDRFGARMPPPTNPQVWPQVLIIPCVGFNDGRFRLGYGGGFYDRTLEAVPRPRTVGVSYALGAADFAADTFDVALDILITERETRP